MLTVNESDQEKVYRNSLQQAGLTDLFPEEFELWRSLVTQGDRTVGWVSPGLMGRIITVLLGRPVSDGVFTPDPILEDWVTRLRRNSAVMSIFRRFNWRERNDGVVRYLIPFFSQLSVHVQLLATLNWGDPPSDLQKERLSESDAAQNSDEFNTILRNALRDDLLHPLGISQGFAARVEHPDIISRLELETMADGWITIVHETQSRLSEIDATRPVMVQEAFQDQDRVASGGYDDIEPKEPGHWDALLTSELAYMEEGTEIDLFDLKVAQHDLLHYTRQAPIERHARREFRIIMDARAYLEDERILGWYMAWWELLLGTIRRRLNGDYLRFILIFPRMKSSLWKNAIRLLHTRLAWLSSAGKTEILHERPLTGLEGAFQPWLIGSADESSALYSICPLEPDLAVLGRITHEETVVRRYTTALYDILEQMEGAVPVR